MNINVTGGGTFYICERQNDPENSIKSKLATGDVDISVDIDDATDTDKTDTDKSSKIAAANLDPAEPRVHRVLTYGTYDLLHWGHINLLRRAKALGDYLIVALSTDEFNKMKAGKKQSYHDYQHRKMMLEAVRYVDLVIPEKCWEQKRDDVKNYHVDTVVMGSDWKGDEHFEQLRDLCDVVYLPRTKGVSTSKIKEDLGEDAS